MKTLRLPLLLASLLSATSLPASVTLSFEGGALFGADTGSPLADSALIYAIARPAGTAFDGPDASGFTGANEILLGKWTPDSAGMGAPGAFSEVMTGVSLSGGLEAGMDVWLVWFPDLTLDSATPAPGFVYGSFHQAGWILPADGTTASYTIETESVGGALPDADFIASQTISAIPEPRAFPFLAGAIALGWSCALSRRRRTPPPSLA